MRANLKEKIAAYNAVAQKYAEAVKLRGVKLRSGEFTDPTALNALLEQ